MPEGETAEHQAVILQTNKGRLSEQPPVEEANDGDRDDGDERKYQQAKKAGQKERIRLQREDSFSFEQATPSYHPWLIDDHHTRRALTPIPFDSLHMPELLDEHGYAL